jgi:8-oxo-dGTP diphosphatase
MAKQPSAERLFLDSYDPSQFERPSVSVDVVLIAPKDGRLWTVLVRRTEHPFKGQWALPGGFVGIKESLDRAAGRVLADKAGVRNIFLEQLYTFGGAQRDPRMRIISVAYYALIDIARLGTRRPDGNTLASISVPWEREAGGPVTLHDASATPLPIAFDHGEIVGMTVKRIRGKLSYAPIAYELLPEQFTLSDLQRVHETILGRALNKDSFRRSILGTGNLEATGDSQNDVGHRPAALYRFRKNISKQ